ncbi:MAG: hypothetical protein EPN39_16790 [Chitinophagaceae bacterium]|nr:MAG: hypothetical protein EPN39_16790 [Chitinophagaceae bacterium]
MKWRFILLLLMLLTTFQASEAQNISSPARQVDSVTNKVRHQGDELQQLPSRYFAKVSSKADLFNRRMTKRTEKSLRRLQKQEEKINRKLSKIDSVAAKGLALGNSIDSISHLQELVRNKVTKITSRIPSGKYIPYLDSLQTSLNFLSKYQADLSKAGGVEKGLSGSLNTLRQAQGDLMKAQGSLRQAQADVQQLEGKLNQVQDVQQYIQQRQQLLTQALSKYGGLFSKNIGSISKECYYYKTTIENYKELWQHPDQVEAKAMELLNKMPAFTKFMQEHSMIAGLFRIPSGYGSAGSVAGLQTRSMVEQELQQRIQQAGPNGMQQIQQQMQQAQQQLQQLQNKLPGGGSSASMPDFKPNDLKSKTLFQRLDYGTNLQFEKATGWYPTTSDIAAQIGYKFSKNGSAGIGASFKLGWGNIHKIHFTAQGLGVRSYLDYKLKGTFYLNGGFEMMYNTTIPDIPALKNWNGWTRSALLGIERKYKISSPFGGNKGGFKGDLMLLFNFLYKQQVPPVRSPLVFRMGYNF